MSEQMNLLCIPQIAISSPTYSFQGRPLLSPEGVHNVGVFIPAYIREDPQSDGNSGN